MKLLYILLILSVLLTGCSKRISENDYFPLQDGLRWEYQVYEEHTNDKEVKVYTVENIGSTAFDGKYFEMPITVRRTGSGTDYFILSAEDGLFRIAQKTIVQADPTMDEPERKILPKNDEISEGQSWFVESKTYTLSGAPNDSVPDTEDIRFEMEYEVTSMNETVEVPAGQFENCIKVEGFAAFPLYVDPKLGYQDVEIQQTEWYAPGVGLIKLVREEPRKIGLFEGGNVTFELLRMEK
ncbi:MAG: hypothetical protein AAGJ37_01150 [Pseudomonadota bacterium]